MSDNAELTISVNKEEKEQYQSAIIDSIKLISQACENTKTDNYPIISTLCDLFKKLQN